MTSAPHPMLLIRFPSRKLKREVEDAAHRKRISQTAWVIAAIRAQLEREKKR